MRKQRRRQSAVEWVGGILELPGYVMSEGEPYRPETLLWMGPDGRILGHAVGKPGQLVNDAASSLKKTMAAPMVGPPHQPTRVRVASEELADAIRAGHPRLAVTCAPTPELDPVIEGMRQNAPPAAPSYLHPGLDADAMGAFFEAAAALYRAKPWRAIPRYNLLTSLTVQQFSLQEAVLAFIGAGEADFAMLVFEDLEDFIAFADAMERRQGAPQGPMPPHFAISFARGAELAPELRKEVARYGWKVSSAGAYPRLSAVDGDGVARPPSSDDLTLAQGLSLALTEFCKDPAALQAATTVTAPFARDIIVATHDGPLEVRLRYPFDDVRTDPSSDDDLDPAGRDPVTHDDTGRSAGLVERPAERPPYDLLTDFFQLARTRDLDGAGRRELQQELLRQYSVSPEGRSTEPSGAPQLILDLAARYFCSTIATLTPDQLIEILFDLIPSKVMTGAEEAPAIIDEAHAFFSFLDRVYQLPQAEPCLEILESGAEETLAHALGDRGNFGLGKSLLSGVDPFGPPPSAKEASATKGSPAKKKAPKNKAPSKKAPSKKAPKNKTPRKK